MAGGMTGKSMPFGRAPTLAERIAATKAAEAERARPPGGPDRGPLERLRHCWVTADEHGRLPALLLEWRQTPSGWEARVVRPVLDMIDEVWRPREEWLPAEQLEQA